jgi:hypothetical protein
MSSGIDKGGADFATVVAKGTFGPEPGRCMLEVADDAEAEE